MDWYGILKDFAAPTVALIGVGVTGSLAYAGLKTFDRWKREKLEENRISVALDALAISFEASHVFDEIIKSYEYEDMKIDGAGVEQRGPYAILKRMQAKQPFFDKALSVEPKFLAVFGRDKNAIFERLFSARWKVIVSAETLIDDNRSPENNEVRMERVKWRKQIFASPGTVDSEDEVGKLLQQFQNEIEEFCAPIVHRRFK
jgi:hypothetical protein